MTMVGTGGASASASPASVVSSSPPKSGNLPSSSGRKKIGPKKTKTSRKSSLRVLAEILLVLVVVESYAYWKLSVKEYDEMEQLRAMEDQIVNKIVSPQRYKAQQASPRNQNAAEERKRNREEQQRLKAKKLKEERYKQKKEQQNLTVIDDLSNEAEADDKFLRPERQKTADKLRHMGISGEVYLTELPPWSQILDNFNSVTRDDEPVILGLEHCEAFRKKTNPKHIGFGPAGLFSTGTNLINTLGRSNCLGPLGREGMSAKFGLVQVPYGKHNPADARFHHQVKAPVVPDREAILPIVAIRHPYTWMSAMCKHSYRTRWKHNKNKCHESLYLENHIIEVPWGFKKYNETHNVTNSYQSLAHMWKDWYKPYFLDETYNQTPRLMVRHEDMVYRPEKVISKICECVGGTNRNPNPDWEHPDGFEYEEESANKGKGHGKLGRSGLLSAVIKYGQPLRNWYDQYDAKDREIMKEAFQGEKDPLLRKIFETFQYPLFDDVGEPTANEKALVRKRVFAEIKEKEAQAKEKEQKKLEEEQAKTKEKPKTAKR